jgi:hypothetical protein
MRRCLILSAIACLLLAGVARADPAYAPTNRTGPPLDVPQGKLAAAFKCSKGIDHAAKTPVLLLHGTGSSSKDNFGWNYEPAFDDQGIPWCAVDSPYNGNGDIPTNGEYIVYAIRTMYERAGRPISIAGHSQGGMVGRWALRFWPDTRRMVDDVIGFAPSNHGTTQTGLSCRDSCLVSSWQQAYMSNFIRALNSYQETFSGISYTNVYSHNDEIVRPNADDTGSSSLHGGGGRISNVAVQDVCPADPSEHDLLGTVDAVAYRLAMDALTHDGPADKSRLAADTCTQPYMPGINPVNGVPAGLQAFYDDESSTGPTASSEPPLACYVFASCRFGARSPTCAGAARIRFRLHASRRERIVAANVYVDGRRVARKRGNRLRSITLKRPAPGSHTIKLVTRASDGVRRMSVRRMRGCKIGHPRGRRLRRA